jgi:3-phosphoshikimate 1-carboxyvinyltransferase
MSLEVRPASRALSGGLTPPGDKSISHRALIFASLAKGRSTLSGLLDAADTRATRNALAQLGAGFIPVGSGFEVEGLGGRLEAPGEALDMGNSGTAMRLLAGVLAAQSFDSVLVGDASLSGRPMRRIMKPLALMGASIEASEGDTAPLRISGRALRGIAYDSPVASAQVKSCVLLAGLYASGTSSVREPMLSRDHTERMLPVFGVEMPRPCTVRGGSELRAAALRVPADPSSAAFAAAAALMVPGSDVVLHDVGLNPTRTGFFRALQAMGAAVETKPQQDLGGEPVGTVRVRYTGSLRAIDLPGSWIPSMIDEIPVLMALAATATGTSRIRGATELRVKESDRLSVMSTGLQRLGVDVSEYPDGCDIVGQGGLRSARVDGCDDHRCAMSFALLGMLCPDGVTVDGADYIDTSYPGFVQDLVSLGADLSVTGRGQPGS